MSSTDPGADSEAKTPSERYAASRKRAKHPHLAAFRGLYPFPLDDFQVDACEVVEDGHGVLVAAPPGESKPLQRHALASLVAGGKLLAEFDHAIERADNVPSTWVEIGQADNVIGIAEFLDPSDGNMQRFYRSRLILP